MSTKKNNQWPLPSTTPEKAGFSAERLARIRPAMQKFIDQKKVPNIVTLLARDGKIVHLEAQGYLDFESREPVTLDSFFRLYSNSKPIAGVATMILVEEGLLSLDDPVSKYIPAFKNQVVLQQETSERVQPGPPTMTRTEPSYRGITVRDCLRNTTGLATPRRSPVSWLTEFREVTTELGWNASADINSPPRLTFLQRVEAQAKLPLTFQPGTQFEYHVGYPVLGAVLEKVTGETLEEFYQERIFRPLGMKDSSFYIDKSKLARFPACYQPQNKKNGWELALLDGRETSLKVKGPKVHFAAGGDMGGILATIGDYARFGQMLLNGGELDGVRILGRKTVELMTASHTGSVLIPMLGPGFGFGMGVGVYTGGSPRPTMRSVGTYGWSGAAGTNYFADPKEKMLVICFTQVLGHSAMPGNTFQEDFERLAYQALV
jgi:CubicO group peptidase (beta-lactamase class C family)